MYEIRFFVLPFFWILTCEQGRVQALRGLLVPHTLKLQFACEGDE